MEKLKVGDTVKNAENVQGVVREVTEPSGGVGFERGTLVLFDNGTYVFTTVYGKSSLRDTAATLVERVYLEL